MESVVVNYCSPHVASYTVNDVTYAHCLKQLYIHITVLLKAFHL